MQAACRTLLLVLALSFVVFPPFAAAQAVLTTLQVGQYPQGAAVNTVTNRIYIANECGNDPSCESTGTVTVVDGATNNVITTVSTGYYTLSVAVNPVTNRIYVANECAASGTCDQGTVTVIDGVTNSVIATVNAGNEPQHIAVNSVTNEIYAVNICVSSGSCSQGSVTVIDGATNNVITTVTVGHYPDAIAVNSMTNKIYVVNEEGFTVTVIDGVTNGTTTVDVGYFPLGIAINAVTNQIYVTDSDDDTVTVIDGVTNNTTTVNVGYYPSGVDVNSVTNKIYVANECAAFPCYSGSVTVIDGVTLETTTIPNTPSSYSADVVVDSQRNKIYVAGSTGNVNVLAAIDGATMAVLTLNVGDYPTGMALNGPTNTLYVPNSNDNTASIIAPGAKLQLFPVYPCRVVDTRNPNGPFGGPAIQGGTYRDFPIPQGPCNIPATAVAYVLNVAVVPHQPLGYLTVWPSSQDQPTTATLNSLDGRVKANAAIVQGGLNGAVSVYASNTTDVILDINAYFAFANDTSLAFFPLTPCRVADTRNPPGDLGGPALTGGVPRNFPILEAPCNIPDTAQAYSLNFAAVPNGPLGYLTVWPEGKQQPVVATLNDPTGTVVANAAIVQAGTGGGISAFASNNTNLVIDINGYFAPANSGSNPLSLYPLPCRAFDTRLGRGGEFSGELVIDILENENFCAVSDQAQAYVLNATVVPVVPLGYLTLWPDGESQPTVATLNAIDGAITSNMAIVPTLDGLIDAYASNLTQLILDSSGYFAH